MIAIKDMKMPSCCNECPMYQSEDSDYCDITGAWITGEEMERHSDCPLTEIVTCKDCKHCYHITDAPKVLVCEKHNCQQVSKNFFCADGERRE